MNYKNIKPLQGEYINKTFINYNSKGLELVCNYTDETWLHITDKEIPGIAP